MSTEASGPGAAPVTRRQVLRLFGSIGGSSMMLGTMRAWDLRAAPLPPRPNFGSPAQSPRVIILGAGVSGLVTGYELSKLGYDYQILDARNRVGGLAWSVKRGDQHTELGDGGEHQICNFDPGQHFNAGPWRIPNDHHGLIGYCRELGVRLEHFNDDNTVMWSDDPALGPLANRKVHLREITSDLWGRTSELLAKALNQGSLDAELSAEDKDQLLQFLVRAGYLDSADRMYEPNPRVRGSADPYDLSALLGSPFRNQVRSLHSNTGGPVPVFEPTGGMMEISLAFHRYHGNRVILNTQVVSVRSLEDGVRVVVEDTASGSRREIAGDYVVCCLPMTILKRLDVNFSPGMATAVQASGHSQSSKMGLQMRRRFWEEDDRIFGGHLAYTTVAGGDGQGAANPIPQFSYPSHDYGSQKGVLLGFYGNPSIQGPDGVPLIDSPVRNRIEHVLFHGSRVHPQMREEFEAGYAVMWPRVPFSEGAWASGPGPRMAQLSQPDGRIYLGSAAVSSDPSWQEGAIESAWRVVEQLQTRVGQTG